MKVTNMKSTFGWQRNSPPQVSATFPEDDMLDTALDYIRHNGKGVQIPGQISELKATSTLNYADS